MTDSNPGTHSIPSPVVAPPRWSRNVVRTEVSGHSCLVYAERPPSVPSLLLDARRWQGRTTFVQGDRRITFDAHERAVMRVVRRLQRAEIRARDRVLLFGTNQVEWVVAFWAIQCLGGVAVLGNAWWSEKELREVIEMIHPKLALTDAPRPGGLSDDIPHLSFSDLRELVDDDQESPEFELARIDEDDWSPGRGRASLRRGEVEGHHHSRRREHRERACRAGPSD